MAVKVIDLGLAKSINEPGSQTAISTPGGFVGTPEFASPEQFGGLGVDIRSDLYALGATLWQSLTGYAVFRGSAAEVMYQHQHAPLPIDQLEGFPQPVVILLEVLLEILKRFSLRPVIGVVLEVTKPAARLFPVDDFGHLHGFGLTR